MTQIFKSKGCTRKQAELKEDKIFFADPHMETHLLN